MPKSPQGGQRLQKYLASLGVGSRRNIEELIEQGKIRVEGRVAKLGDKVTPGTRITVNGRPVRGDAVPKKRRVILYNKPEGELTTRNDPGNRPTVFRGLPKLKGERWVAVGRLDINTRGLLLFTNDGELANQLMHPGSNIEREYLCRVYGDVSVDSINRLTAGVRIDGEKLQFQKVRRNRGEHRNTWYSVVVKEGRYREVRRMWEAVGCKLSRLIRVRYGNVSLPRSLKTGQWQELNPTAVTALTQTDSPRKSQRKTRTGKPGP